MVTKKGWVILIILSHWLASMACGTTDFRGCDRAIPKILIGRESDILSDKSNSYELLGKDIKIAG